MKPEFSFSLVCALLNGRSYLERAVSALLGQTYRHWEFLVQDGGSTDGGPEYLAGIGDPRIKIVSESDMGVYDAWNKALARAEGQWIMFLGADDFLVEKHTLARSARCLADLDEAIQFAQAGLQIGKGAKVRDTVARSKGEIFRFFVSGMPLLTPAVFFRRDLFAGKAAPFDSSYKIAGDFAFVSAQLRPDNLALLPFITTYMESGGLSSAVRSRPVLDAERRRVLSEIIKPQAANLVQYCIDTYGETRSPLQDESA